MIDSAFSPTTLVNVTRSVDHSNLETSGHFKNLRRKSSASALPSFTIEMLRARA